MFWTLELHRRKQCNFTKLTSNQLFIILFLTCQWLHWEQLTRTKLYFHYQTESSKQGICIVCKHDTFSVLPDLKKTISKPHRFNSDKTFVFASTLFLSPLLQEVTNSNSPKQIWVSYGMPWVTFLISLIFSIQGIATSSQIPLNNWAHLNRTNLFYGCSVDQLSDPYTSLQEVKLIFKTCSTYRICAWVLTTDLEHSSSFF